MPDPVIDRWFLAAGCLLILLFAIFVGFAVRTPADPQPRGGSPSTTTMQIHPHAGPSTSIPVPGQIVCYDPNGWYPIHTDMSRYDKNAYCQLP